MKIYVITPNYTIAGVPLAQLRFARALLNKGFQVELIVGNVPEPYQIPYVEGLEITVLDKGHARKMLFPLMKFFKLKKPKLVFSAEDHLNVIVLLAAMISRSDAKISCSSRVTPFDTYSDKFFSKRWFLKQAAKIVFPRADVLSCVSIDMVTQYNSIFKNLNHIPIYNVIKDDLSIERMQEDASHKWLNNPDQNILIAAGRLAPWKGFDSLIKAMPDVLNKKNVKLIILGDGPMKDELDDLIKKLNLQNTVDLPGYVNNPLSFYAKADIFVLSSLVEGLPNVLVEAMMCGCTPVATNCPTGPMEVLHGGKYGYLVPVNNQKAMSEAIVEALDNPIPKYLLDEAVEPFTVDNVVEQHFSALNLKKELSK